MFCAAHTGPPSADLDWSRRGRCNKAGGANGILLVRGPNDRLDLIAEQLETYKRALDEAGRPFPMNSHSAERCLWRRHERRRTASLKARS